MPQLKLATLLLIRRSADGLLMARVWGFPEYSILAATQQQAEQTLLHQLQSWLAHAPPMALAGRLFADLPASELRRVAVPLSPPTRQSHWRTAFTLQLDYVVVRTAAHLYTAWVPELNLTILTNQLEQVESQLQRQVLAFLRRQRRLNLGDLTQFQSGDHQTRLVTLEIEVKTPSQRRKRAEQTAARAQKTLARYARRMLPSELPPAYCFAPMIERVAALMRPPNSESVLLVGPAGVGKTALFQQLVRQQVELGFLTQQFWSTDGSTIVAGACGFGMWQQRCERLVAGCQQASAWLHLGNLFELDEAGRIGGAVGVGGYLAGPIGAGKLPAVAECTDQQFALLERKSPELIAAFHVVQIEPADASLTTDILLEWATAEASGRGLYHTVGVAKKRKKNRSRTRTMSARKGTLVKQVSRELQSVRVEPEAIALLERLQRRFPTDVAAPGRPLRMLQQWASELRQAAETSVLTAGELANRFAVQTGLPRFLIDPQAAPDLSAIEQQLANDVIGQQPVVSALVELIAMLAADLQRPQRPLASLLLCGPTGVGKTETAKALARLIYSHVDRMVRIDMSEFATPDAAERLIGGPGRAEGALTGAVRSQPFSVLLLDEFEKADPAVFDLLLQVLGEGRLTDGRGRTANFCNCLVLLTSNLGADSFRERSLGLGDEQQTDRYQQHFENRVREFFRPEMVNRIDRIIAYRPLEPEVVRQIARQRITALSQRDGWREAAANLDVRDEAIQWLAARGYQPKYGARPLVRTIEQRLVVPVAEELLKVMRGNSKQPAKDTLQVALVEADAGWQGSPLQVSWVVGAASGETAWSTGGDHAERSAAPAIATAARNVDQCARLAVAWTKLRRRSQMLLQTDGYHDLKSRLTGLRRERESIRKGSNRSAPQRTEHSSPERTGKQQQRFHQLSAEENKLRNQLGQWQTVLDRIAAEESEMLLASYRGEAFDSDASAVRLDRLKLELWEILGSLITGRSVRDEAITVVVLSPNLRAAWPLIDAYQQLASKRDFRAAAYALRPLTAESQELSAEADGEGFGVEPKAAIQLTPRISEKLWSVSNQVPADENVPPTIAAHRFRSAAVLMKYPADSLGIAFELTGYCARLLLEDERGQHVFRLSDHASAAQDVTTLVETFAGPLANYQVPRQLEQRKLPPLGDLRRFYKLSNQVMRDAHAKNQHSWGHSFANTLEGLLEDWLDQRIWDQLV